MTPPESPRRPGWRTSDLVRAAAVALGVYAAARFLLAAHSLVFAAFLGVLFGLAVAAGADRLHRYRIPRGLAAGGIVVGFVALLVGFGVWMGPTVSTQYGELRQRLPEAFAKLDRWIGERQGGLIGSVLGNGSAAAPGSAAATPAPAAPTAPVVRAPMPPSGAPGAPATPLQRLQDNKTPSIQTESTRTTVVVADTKSPDSSDSLTHLNSLKDKLLDKVGGGASRFVFPVITSTFAALSGVLLILFLSIYIGADPDTYRNGIIQLIPPAARDRWRQVLEAASKALRRWLVTQLVAMMVIGVVTTTVLLLLGVRAAVPIGILAGLLEFVPTIGPILSAVPAIAMGFIDSPEKAAAVAAAYIGIQFLENHILIPLLMKEGVDLPPVLTILTQAAMALAFGFMGLFVAVPMLVLITILVKMLYVKDVAGDDTPLPYTEPPEQAAPR